MKLAIYGAGGFGREVAPLGLAMGADVMFVSTPRTTARPAAAWMTCRRTMRSSSPSRPGGCARNWPPDAPGGASPRCSPGPASGSAPTPSARGPSSAASPPLPDNARIGRHFHANIHAYVAHDCVVGDFVTLGPKAAINGNVTLGDHVYVGTGAVLKQGMADRPLVIGDGAVIGMGAVVTRDVPAGAVMVGNPARQMERPAPVLTVAG